MATGCKNCDSKCFEKNFDECIGYTGGLFSSLGMVPGVSSVKEVLEALATHIFDLEKKLAGCNNCGDTNIELSLPSTSLAGFDNNNSSVIASKITNNKLKYTVTPGNSETAVEYNFSDIVSNLPSDYKVSKKEVRFYGQSGDNTLYVDSDKTAGVYSFNPNQFPVTMAIKMIVGTDQGTVNLENTVLVNSDLKGSYNSSLSVKDYTKTELGDVTQEEYNEAVKNRVLSNERKVDTLEVPNVTGTNNVQLKEGASLEQILQKLVIEVNDLKS